MLFGWTKRKPRLEPNWRNLSISYEKAFRLSAYQAIGGGGSVTLRMQPVDATNR